MTREEQRDKAAEEYTKRWYKEGLDIEAEDYPTDARITIADFTEGAKWADNHPDWHDANEELPEPDDDGCYSNDVLVDIYGDVYSGCYNHRGKFWVIYDFGANRSTDDVIYWMPFPKPLKEDY